ncbi:plant cysteine oxidase 4 isoform X2 [Cryptomeria japonica]|uniref:plant cysteine oxidase 4 isoform X2 n=1 Tax=Cryptomeria japonica TaxID=3369 RepID=UPI0027DA1CF0|nr:plant cysteine oxidase 4 isoform X2 [Cryptomeria japonica]
MIAMSSSAVQNLYQLCEEIFTPPGIVPPPPAVNRLTSFLETIRAVDVGLQERRIMEIEQHSSLPYMAGPNRRRRQHRRSRTVASSTRTTWTPPVTYIQVHESPSFSIGIFCLPTSSVIPLHDHANMTVFSKILYGSMHINSYDWLDPQPTVSFQHPYPLDLRLAALKVDGDFAAPCEVSVLYPTSGGNIHSFTALTSCAVLDILSPPYSGNPSYFRECPYPGLPGNEDGVWLEEIEKPDNFFMRQYPYTGPVIDVT